jgi:hypothetical protein
MRVLRILLLPVVWAILWHHELQERKGVKLRCSFCGKTQDEVSHIVAGPCVHICNECVDLCVDIIAEDKKKYPPKETNEVPR